MEEIPPSQWEVEPFSQLDIKVIRRDTRMIQRLAMDPNHVDDIHGKVFFVLEPLCTPFETTFTLIPHLGRGLASGAHRVTRCLSARPQTQGLISFCE